MMKSEIYCGFDITEFNRVRDKLYSAGIEHTYKVIDLITPSCLALNGTRTAHGNAPTKQYYIYVSKDDYEKAQMARKKG